MPKVPTGGVNFLYNILNQWVGCTSTRFGFRTSSSRSRVGPLEPFRAGVRPVQLFSHAGTSWSTRGCVIPLSIITRRTAQAARWVGWCGLGRGLGFPVAIWSETKHGAVRARLGRAGQFARAGTGRFANKSWVWALIWSLYISPVG